MKLIKVLPSFERSVKRLNFEDKKRLAKSLELFNNFLLTAQIPSGLCLKKIDKDKYEFRVDIRLRVIVKQEKDTFYLVLAGSHDKIRQYLRRFRNK
ncbi:hypothetical protein KAW08_02410 [bacterium]|nr:hypothetical protein [bacterium]